jgi:hypothetical protein
MTVDEAERMRDLLQDVDFPEPRHDVGHTIRVGRRHRAVRWTAAVATGTAMVAAATTLVQLAPWAGPTGRDDAAGPPAGPVRATASAPADCKIEHLALPGGVTSATTSGIDPTGRYVIGFPDESRTILWTDGQPKVLPAGAAGAEAVNASGVVVGSHMTGGGGQAWVYRGGKVSPLAVPAGGEAAQVSINTAGDIAGTLLRDGRSNVAVVWPAAEPGTYRILEAPGASMVRAITDSGVVVGSVEGVGPYRWDADGTGRPMATLPGLAKGAVAHVAGNWGTGLLESALTEPTPHAGRPQNGFAAVRWNLTTGEVTPVGVEGLPAGVDAAGRVLLPENPPRLIGLDNVVRPLPPDPRLPRMHASGISDNGIVAGSASTDDKDPNAGPDRSQPLRWLCK